MGTIYPSSDATNVTKFTISLALLMLHFNVGSHGQIHKCTRKSIHFMCVHVWYWRPYMLRGFYFMEFLLLF